MNQLYIKRRQVPEVIFLSRCSFTGRINATMALQRLSGVSKEIILMVRPPFVCHLWDSTASAGMDVSANSTAAVDVSKSFSSSRIWRWSITVMWKTCWFTRGRWPLFACVWHRRCACDREWTCVSCVFIFWRFQRELPKVKRGGFVLSWKNLNRSKTKCEAWSCWALGLHWSFKDSINGNETFYQQDDKRPKRMESIFKKNIYLTAWGQILIQLLPQALTRNGLPATRGKQRYFGLNFTPTSLL